MLEKLLAEIRFGGTLEIRSLANRLDTTPEVVTAMLEYLHRAGYIQPYQTCHSACDGCGLKTACQTTSQAAKARLWQA